MGEAGAAVLRELYPSSEDERRALILYLCAEAGSCQVTDLVADGLVSDYPPLRRVATEAVGKLGLSRYAGRVAMLLGDGVDFVADGAVGALKRLVAVDRKAVEDAIGDQLLMPLPASRRHAARLYATLGDVERLLRLLKDEDAAVRKEAVTALASLRSPSATNHLLMTMVDEDPDVRIAVLEALGDLGDRNLLEPLSLALQDEDPWVVCAALRSLARCCGVEALEPIMALMEEAEGVVLITALEALGLMEGERVQAALLRSLGHSDEEVVKAAMEILAGFDSAWIKEYRSQLLGNPHWDVRATFATVAVQSLGADARPLLEEALAAEHDAMVRQKIEGLLDSIR
jgi:HEAT repeat protein